MKRVVVNYLSKQQKQDLLDKAIMSYKYFNKLEAGKVEDCDACGARSSGQLEDDTSNDDHKVPPDQSDSKQAVDPSDRLTWDGKKANNQTPGTKPGYSDRFGSPNIQSPGSGTGPRVKNTGGSKSDFARQLSAGKRVGKIWNKKKMKAVAPPGKEKQVRKLKEKFGEDSSIPFKIAWSQEK